MAHRRLGRCDDGAGGIRKKSKGKKGGCLTAYTVRRIAATILTIKQHYKSTSWRLDSGSKRTAGLVDVMTAPAWYALLKPTTSSLPSLLAGLL